MPKRVNNLTYYTEAYNKAFKMANNASLYKLERMKEENTKVMILGMLEQVSIEQHVKSKQ